MPETGHRSDGRQGIDAQLDERGQRGVLADVSDDEEGVQLSDPERSNRALMGGPWLYDAKHDLFSCSPDVYRLHGLEPPALIQGELMSAQVTTGEWLDLLDPGNRETVSEMLACVLAVGGVGEHEYRIETASGTRYLRAHIEVATNAGGEVERMAGFTYDVTAIRQSDDQHRQAQGELSLQRRILQRIAGGEPLTETLEQLCRYIELQLPSARCTILVLDRAAGVLRRGASATLPAAFEEELDGLPVAEGMGACGTAAARGEPVIVDDLMADPLTAEFTDLGRRFKLGAVWSQPLRKSGGEVLGTFAVYRPFTFTPGEAEMRMVVAVGHLAALAIDRENADAALRTAANFDSLTGLPNRARFLELVNRQLQDPDRRLSVLFLELDRFKQINDGFGHIAGDRILVEVGRRLREAVGHAGLVSRFGGDAFTIMVSFSDSRRLKELAARVLKAIEQPLNLDGAEFFLTASIGIAANHKSTDAYGLVRDADAALYAARSAGHGHTQVYDRKLRAQLVARLTRETELRRAITDGGLVMHYQPIVSLTERVWSGVEALVRWQHPKRGLMAPMEFIPLAEETGLIVPLGTEILRLVGEQARRWSKSLPAIRIGVNASVLQLARPDMADQVLAMVGAAGIEPDTLVLEVTESALMEQLDTTRNTLDELVAAGVHVLIDDFGTGYSSLARLGELPISGLKIDRRFTRGLGSDPAVRPVVRALADLARAYRLLVVAEGIEDEFALRDAGELGCHYAQGFYLGRPGTPEQTEALLTGPPPAGAGVKPLQAA